MKWNLRNRFLIPTILLFIIGMGISSTISYIKSKDTLQASIAMQITRMADGTVTLLDSLVENIKLNFAYRSEDATLATVVQDVLGETVIVSAHNMLEKMKRDYGYYEQAAVSNAEGKIIAGTAAEEIGKSIEQEEYFKESMSGKIFVSDVMKSKATGKPVFIVSCPLKMNETVVGVHYGIIDLGYFSRKFVEPVKFGERGYTFVCRPDGLVIAHPDESKILKFNITTEAFGRDIMNSGQGLTDYVLDGVEKQTAYKKSESSGWIVGVCADRAEALSPIKHLSYINIGVAAAAVTIAAIVILLIVSGTVRPIYRVVVGLSNSAESIAAASRGILSATRQLTEGASEQAASSEETASSLEQLASMTRKNAENAETCNKIVKDSQTMFGKAHESMTSLKISMDEISKSGEQTFNIIKTIDEIAFQTNLLALNAAVEAARAGEAGAGFAVVAEEVRSLAMRSTEAARSTAGLIQSIVKKIKDGGKLATQTNEAFGAVAHEAVRIGELVTDIAAASSEQAQGIEQVSKAVDQMDTVTQQNVSNSEETSSASEDMKAQAEQMKGFVAELAELVGNDAENHAESDDREAAQNRMRS
jgi:methyl-accepting chemotaxis protein